MTGHEGASVRDMWFHVPHHGLLDGTDVRDDGAFFQVRGDGLRNCAGRLDGNADHDKIRPFDGLGRGLHDLIEDAEFDDACARFLRPRRADDLVRRAALPRAARYR